jgi:hypothetical protein
MGEQSQISRCWDGGAGCQDIAAVLVQLNIGVGVVIAAL